MTKEQSQAESDRVAVDQSITELGVLLGAEADVVANLIKEYAPMLARVIETARCMPEVMQKALICLANEGWYLDWKEMSFSAPAELAQMYFDGRKQEADARLVEHFSNRLQSIERELIGLYPKRAEIFRQAFDAHRQALFFVSVPTFLAQSDGICAEILREHFFQKPKGATHHFEKLSDALNPLTKAMLAPFFDRTAIRLSQDLKSGKGRPRDFDKLNRHQVLHGESCDYVSGPG